MYVVYRPHFAEICFWCWWHSITNLHPVPWFSWNTRCKCFHYPDMTLVCHRSLENGSRLPSRVDLKLLMPITTTRIIMRTTLFLSGTSFSNALHTTLRACSNATIWLVLRAQIWTICCGNHSFDYWVPSSTHIDYHTPTTPIELPRAIPNIQSPNWTRSQQQRYLCSSSAVLPT